MNKKQILLLCLLILLLLTSCSPKIPEITPEATTQISLQAYVFNTPEPGTISARGVLAVTDPFSVIPAADDAIYLVPLASGENVASIPPIQTSGTIQAEVDEGSGEFRFTNISPGQYVIVVREKSGSELPANMVETDGLAIFTFEEANRGQIIDLGLLRFP